MTDVTWVLGTASDGADVAGATRYHLYDGLIDAPSAVNEPDAFSRLHFYLQTRTYNGLRAFC